MTNIIYCIRPGKKKIGKRLKNTYQKRTIPSSRPLTIETNHNINEIWEFLNVSLIQGLTIGEERKLMCENTKTAFRDFNFRVEPL